MKTILFPGITTKIKLCCVALLCCITLFSTCNYSFAQREATFYATSVTSANLHQAKDSGLLAMRSLYSWKDLEPTKGAYNFSLIQDDLQRASDSGFHSFNIEVSTGSEGPITGATNWLVSVDGVQTFTTSGGTDPGPWPNYYNTKYNTALLKFHDTLFRWAAGLPATLKNKLTGIMVKYGSTGDIGPYKGNPVGTSYGVADDATWDAWRKAFVDSCYSYKQKYCPWLKLRLNAGNSRELMTYYSNKYHENVFKWGDPTHNYLFNGENLPKIEGAEYYGEIQGPILQSTFPDSRPLVVAARSLGITELDIPLGAFNQQLHLTKADIAWFNTHVNDEVNNNIGYIWPFDKKCYDSTVTWSVAQYGPVVDPARQTTYNNYVAAVNADATTDQLYKNNLILQKTINLAYSSRVNSMNNIGDGATVSASNYWQNDYGWSLSDNYGINITQVASRTAQPYYRLNNTSGYARAGKGFKIVAGKGEMFFNLSNTLKDPKRIKQHLQITVVYYDTSYTTWAVTCIKCANRSQQARLVNSTLSSIKNNDTRQIKTAVFDIPSFTFGSKYQGADFGIKYIAGPTVSVPILYIEVLNVTKGTN